MVPFPLIVRLWSRYNEVCSCCLELITHHLSIPSLSHSFQFFGRVTTLRKVLHHPEQASVVDLQDIIRWKNNLNVGEDELQDMRLPGSSLYMTERKSRDTVIGMTPIQSLQQEAKRSQPGVFPEQASSLNTHLPKSPGVNRRSTALGIRPASVPFGKHGPAVNRTTSLQYSQNPKHVSLRRSDLYGDSSDQDSLYAVVAPSSNERYAAPFNGKYTAPSANERYVPLTVAAAPRNQDLPESLQHIDLNAFRENIPQEHRVYSNSIGHGYMGSPGNSHGNHGYYYVDHYGNPIPEHYATYIASQESLADSGIVPTQGSPSYSQNGFSPHTGLSGGPTILETDGQTARDSHNGLNHAKSMPNLKQEFDEEGILALTRANIENVMNSDLTPEEKLDVMAAMCEGNDKGGRKGLSRVPSHVRNALNKVRSAASKKDSSVAHPKHNQKHPLRPKSAVYNPQPPGYKTVQQTRRPLSAQEMTNQTDRSSDRMYHRTPTVYPSVYHVPVNTPREHLVPQRMSGTYESQIHDFHDPAIRYSHPYVQPQTVHYKVPTEFMHPKPPNIIPVHEEAGGPRTMYHNIVDALPPVLIPITETDALPRGPKSGRDHHDVTTESEVTSDTVLTEDVRPQKAEHKEQSELKASQLPSGTSRPYGIDIEQWVSQQQEVGAVPHQESFLESSLDCTSDDYMQSQKNRERYGMYTFD